MKLLCKLLGHKLDKGTGILKNKKRYYSKQSCLRCGKIIRKQYYKLSSTAIYNNEEINYVIFN